VKKKSREIATGKNKTKNGKISGRRVAFIDEFINISWGLEPLPRGFGG
jgi:hypothetical protein